MKTFCSAQDIEDLAAQGKTELIIDENIVLTDLARHTAEQLGIKLVPRSRSAPQVATLPSAPTPVRGAPVGLGGKPKGCQHGPLTSQATGPVAASTTSNPVVDQLVSLVKRLGGRGTEG